MSLAPLGDGIRDAADELLDGAFALFGAHDPVEIFGDHDVGGRLGPALGDLDVLLLENHFAFFVGDGGGTEFPLHFIEGVDALLGEITLDLQAAVTGESIGPHESLESRLLDCTGLDMHPPSEYLTCFSPAVPSGTFGAEVV